jgi:hypothetical protein
VAPTCSSSLSAQPAGGGTLPAVAARPVLWRQVANIAEVQLMFASRRRLLGVVAGLTLVLAIPGITAADNSWGGYHWARTSNPFTLKVGDNVSGAWDSFLDNAEADWAASSVLNLSEVAGSGNPKPCRAPTGAIQVCNASYGNNGWLGIAGIYITGGEHITKGYVKLNDYYFNQSAYNTTGWRSLVACQEIGHTLGLDHQDEDFNNPPISPHTCMDYFVPDAGEDVDPNQHDYDELVTIYSHNDSFNSYSSPLSAGGAAGAPAAWGLEVARSNGGHTSVFVNDFGGGNKLVTFVIWA